MKFSDSEMMFMISVSRGRKPLGIDIKKYRKILKGKST